MDIVGIGRPCVDLLANVNEMPSRNGRGPMQSYSWQGGGQVPTAMVTATRLGARTGIMGVVGGDPLGRYCLDDFERHAVETRHMVIDPLATTGFSVALSEKGTGSRCIIHNAGNRRSLAVDDLDREYIASARYLHLQHVTHATRQAASWAREAGVTVTYDVERFDRDMADFTPSIDAFIASEECYRQLFGSSEDHEANCRTIQVKGPDIVVFTLGERGSVGVSSGAYFFAKGFDVSAVDTTGAGDVYHGAFLFGLAQGWGIAEVAHFANAVAAIKCTRIGGRAGIPSLEIVQGFLEDGEIHGSELDERVAFYAQIQL